MIKNTKFSNFSTLPMLLPQPHNLLSETDFNQLSFKEPPKGTGFKHYLIDIFLSGKITSAEKNWLSSLLTTKTQLSVDQINLLKCVYEDMQAELIQVVD